LEGDANAKDLQLVANGKHTENSFLSVGTSERVVTRDAKLESISQDITKICLDLQTIT
jgi:hypothetical protein